MEHYKNISLDNISGIVDGVLYLEEWRDVPDYVGYMVSSFGRVKSIERTVIYSNGHVCIHKAKILGHSISRRGYHRVTIFKNRKRSKIMVHKLVAMLFIPNPLNKKTANHKKGIKSHNMAIQLEWATHTEQNEHSFKELGRKSTSGLPIKVDQYDLQNNYITTFSSYSQADRLTSISKSSIIDCINGRAKTAGGFIWQKTKN